jgi:recombination protein RecA
MSELFRVFARDFKSNHLCVIIISQIRDKIDKIGYGAKYTRAGGKSLDFYASHVIYLSHIKTLTRTMNNSKRATAVQIKAKCTKNKISLPFRECEFIIRFGYGVDDLAASLEWLKGINKLKPLGITDPTKFIAETESMSEKDYRARLLEVRTLVNKTWQEVETGFKPKRRKYAEEA